MTNDTPRPSKYPLLENLLAHRGLPLRGTYGVRDVAELFGVSTRTVQVRIKRGDLQPRDLPGTGKFLAMDLEQFLQNSKKQAV